MIGAIDKVQQRITVLEENNHAQEELEEFLNKVPKKTKELNITIPLHGHVNLGVLGQSGFKNIQFHKP